MRSTASCSNLGTPGSPLGVTCSQWPPGASPNGSTREPVIRHPPSAVHHPPSSSISAIPICLSAARRLQARSPPPTTTTTTTTTAGPAHLLLLPRGRCTTPVRQIAFGVRPLSAPDFPIPTATGQADHEPRSPLLYPLPRPTLEFLSSIRLPYGDRSTTLSDFCCVPPLSRRPYPSASDSPRRSFSPLFWHAPFQGQIASLVL